MTEQTHHNETHYYLLRRLADDPAASQRQLAKDLGISLGKVNYCLKALLAKGYIKAGNFKANPHKSNYLYQLTPKGITAKAKVAKRFLVQKQQEYERLQKEITELEQDIAGDN